MYDAVNLRRLAELYAARTGQTLREVGRQAAGAHGFFHRLDSKHGCTLRTAQRAQEFFEIRWPPGLAWPSDIPRSTPVRRKTETAPAAVAELSPTDERRLRPGVGRQPGL
jgi:hypothetical protein